MLIHHHIPPGPKRLGGLDTALHGLNGALNESGVDSALVEKTPWFPKPPFPDVAHFHGMWNARMSWAAARLRKLGVATVASPHGMLEPWALRQRTWKKKPFFNLVEKRRLNLSNAVLATSEMEQTHLRSLLPNARVFVLPLGVDVPPGVSSQEFRQASRNSLGLSGSGPVVLFLSRIDVKKGINLLLQAWHELCQLIAPLKAVLLVVGDGGNSPYEKHCRVLADACTAGGSHVRWIGPVWGEDRWPFFAAADLLCLPSHSENFGFVVPEAWLCGTPVLTTDRTPWRTVDGSSHLALCEPDAGSLREALRNWLNGKPADETARAGIAGRAREQYAWPEVVSSYRTFYQSLIAERSR